MDVRYSFNLEYLIRGVTHDKNNTDTSGDGNVRMGIWDEKKEEERGAIQTDRQMVEVFGHRYPSVQLTGRLVWSAIKDASTGGALSFNRKRPLEN